MITSILHIHSLNFSQKDAWKGDCRRGREKERRGEQEGERERAKGGGKKRGGMKILRMLCNQSIFAGHIEKYIYIHIHTKDIYVCVYGEGETKRKCTKETHLNNCI